MKQLKGILGLIMTYRNVFSGKEQPMRKFLLGTAFVMAIAAMLTICAPKAQGGMVIDYSLDGGATFFTLATGLSGSMVMGGSPTLGVFAVSNISVMSNSPGSPSLAKVQSSSLDIQNTSGATASIEFVFSDTGFTAPVGPPALQMDSHIGGTVTVDNPDNLATFTSCLSSSDANLTNCTGATHVAGYPNITASSFENDQFLNLTSLTGPYSITEVLDVTLGGGSDIGFQANTSISPVPVPASLSLLVAGLACICVIRHRRV